MNFYELCLTKEPMSRDPKKHYYRFSMSIIPTEDEEVTIEPVRANGDVPEEWVDVFEALQKTMVKL